MPKRGCLEALIFGVARDVLRGGFRELRKDADRKEREARKAGKKPDEACLPYLVVILLALIAFVVLLVAASSR